MVYRHLVVMLEPDSNETDARVFDCETTIRAKVVSESCSSVYVVAQDCEAALSCGSTQPKDEVSQSNPEGSPRLSNSAISWSLGQHSTWVCCDPGGCDCSVTVLAPGPAQQ